MKVSLNWIREYLDLPESLDLKTLSHDLTMRTVEVEGAINPADQLNNIVVGLINDIQPHPQADLLKVCLVDVGTDAPSTIVCGGSNIKVGMQVATALPGAMVRWHGEGDPVMIKSTKLRGVKSDGMICAASEIGLEELFPAKDDHEILDLSIFPASPGTPLAAVLELDDIVLEIDNKSLTNRPDLWCHYGLARELASIYAKGRKPLPAFQPPENPVRFPVTIDDPGRCRRYAALQYEGLSNEQSPHWLRVRLWKVGIRPISSLVDVTNYTMLAIGQPTHAFDKNTIRDEIIVRTARSGEQLTLLDDKKLQLCTDDLMICDRHQPIALAGVMGSKDDSILPETSSILLEIANFEPRGVRRSAARYQVRTESAIRNEKGLDTQRVDQAMAVADHLIHALYPDARMSAYMDEYPVKTRCPVIQVSLDWLSIRLGRAISANQAREVLEPLGFAVEENGQNLMVRVPSWRATGDVSQKDDVLEEIARMIGYEHFDFIPPTVRLHKAVNQPGIQLERRVREYLAFSCGMREVYTYPWIHRQFLDAAGVQVSACLELSSPPSPDTGTLRSSLVPAMLEVVEKNLRYFDDFRVFELAQVYSAKETRKTQGGEELPLQQRFLAGALVGRDARLLFRQAKGILESLPRAVMSQPLAFAQREQPAWADSKAWLNILCCDVVIGHLALLSSPSAKAADIKHAQAVLFELNMEALPPLASRTNSYQPLPLFPRVAQDFSVLLDEKVSWAEVQSALEKSVIDLTFVEEYRGKQIPEGKKSLTFTVTFGSDKGTLTSQEIEEKMGSINKKLQKLGGELRI